MSKNFKRSLDESLSGVVFTERMQQNVMRRIAAGAAHDQPRKQEPLRFLVVAAMLMLLITSAFVAHDAGMLINTVGDPVNTPNTLDQQYDFRPIGDLDPTAEPGMAAQENATGDPAGLQSYIAAAESATPEPSDTPTTSPTPTAEPTATPTTSPTPMAKPTATPTPSPTPTAEPTATATPSPTPTAEPTATPTPSPTPTAEPTATPTPSPTPTAEPTATATPSPVPTATPVPTPTPLSLAEVGDVAQMPVLFEDERITVYQAEAWSDGVLNRVRILVMPKQTGVALGQKTGELRVDVQATNMNTTYDMDTFLQQFHADNGLTLETPFDQCPQHLKFEQTCQRTENGGLLFELCDYFLVNNSETDILLCVVIQVQDADGLSAHAARIKFRRDSKKLMIPLTYSRMSLGAFHFYMSESDVDITPQSCFVYVTDHYVHHWLTYSAAEPVSMSISKSNRGPVKMVRSSVSPRTDDDLYVNWMTLDIPDFGGDEIFYLSINGSTDFGAPLTAAPEEMAVPDAALAPSEGMAAIDVSQLPVLYADEDITVYQAKTWSDGVLNRADILVTPNSGVSLDSSDIRVSLQMANMGSNTDADAFLDDALAANGLTRQTALTDYPRSLVFASESEKVQGGGLLFHLYDYFLVRNSATPINLCCIIQVAAADGSVSTSAVPICFYRTNARLKEVEPAYRQSGLYNYQLSADLPVYSSKTYTTNQYVHLFLKFNTDTPVDMYIAENKNGPVDMPWHVVKPSESGDMYVAWFTLDLPESSSRIRNYITVVDALTGQIISDEPTASPATDDTDNEDDASPSYDFSILDFLLPYDPDRYPDAFP